jgi:hypothetical protein
LYPYRDVLSFEFEYPLNREPLRIDAVIIKKRGEAVIDEPGGAIFRGVNIIEYKSPGDYLSIRDYHKAGAYGRLYSVLNGVETGDMTVTFVGWRHPGKLLKYLGEAYGYEVREMRDGIYYVKGDIFGVQVIETKRLKGGDGGEWLKGLRGGLKGGELREILERSRRMPKGSPLSAYIHMILQANTAGFKEILGMADGLLEDVLEEYGFIAKWEAKGREEGWEEGWEEAAKRLQKHGMAPGEIAEALELPQDTVFRYLDMG